MALARVVEFEGVSQERADEMKAQMQGGTPPEGVPPMEFVWLHDPDSEKSVVIQIFDSEEDYQRGEAMLEAMPAEDTPGRRTSVTKYDVAHRQSV